MWAPSGELLGNLPTCGDTVDPVCVEVCAKHPEVPDCVDALSPKYRLGHSATQNSTVHCPTGYVNTCLYDYYRSSGWVSVDTSCFRMYMGSTGWLITNWSATDDHSAQAGIACTTDTNWGDANCNSLCGSPRAQ